MECLQGECGGGLTTGRFGGRIVCLVASFRRVRFAGFRFAGLGVFGCYAGGLGICLEEEGGLVEVGVKVGEVGHFFLEEVLSGL